MSTKQITRDKIAKKDKWKLEDIFKTDKLWEDAFKSVMESIPMLADYKGRLGESAGTLLECLEKMNRLEEAIGKLYAYAHMRNDQDKTNSMHQEQYDRMGAVIVEFNQTVSYFEPEILTLSQKTLNGYLQTEKKLQTYRHFLDNLTRVKPHILSTKEERLMALAGEVRNAPEEIFSNWDNADIEFPVIIGEDGKEVRLTNGLYGKFQQSSDRRLRKDSYINLYKPYLANRNMLAASYSSIIKSHIFSAKARGYKSTLEAALNANNIPVDVYHNLIETAHANLGPLQRFVAMRKKILGLDEVVDYDLRAPLFKSKERVYSWPEARKLVLDGAKHLGPDYVSNLKKGLNEGWIDVYENKGKRSGAYSSGTYGVHPYVLMNFNGTLNDVFTLSHEMGHAMHTFYTINNQPFIYGDYPIFLAEVASTANEALLEKHLIDLAGTREEKLALLNSALDSFNSTFFRQIIFAEFELKSHQAIENGQALSADALDTLFGDIYKLYYGDDFTLLRENQALWSRVPHFYYNYYVFQYSTSFVASAALVSMILEQGGPAREKYLGLLKSGRSKYPMDTLRDAGVDMASAEPVKRAIGRMENLLDQLEELID